MHVTVRLKKLENDIRKNGFDYRLIERTEKKAIYKQGFYGYEVFKIKIAKPHPKSENDIKNFDQIERFPCNEEFGKTAWYYPTLQDAQKRYTTI